MYATRGQEDGPMIEEFFARENTSARAAILDTLASRDVVTCLRSGGLGDDDLRAVRACLLCPAAATARSPAADEGKDTAIQTVTVVRARRIAVRGRVRTRRYAEAGGAPSG